MPKEFPESRQIKVLKNKKVELEPDDRAEKVWEDLMWAREREKYFSVDSVRSKYRSAYMPWTEELDKELTVLYCEGVNVKDLAKHFGRTRGAIRSRIQKLELDELYG